MKRILLSQLYLLKKRSQQLYSQCIPLKLLGRMDCRPYWNTIGNNLTIVIEEFFREGILHPKLNETFTTLSTKVKSPQSIDQWRLISLSNVSYRILSKVLANRIKQVLQKIISKNEATFLEKRWILENCIVPQELIHKMQTLTSRTVWIGIDFDMKKAFNKLE